MSRKEMVARGNLEMYAAGLEARVDILEARVADREKRIRLARKELGDHGAHDDCDACRAAIALDLRRRLARRTK